MTSRLVRLLVSSFAVSVDGSLGITTLDQLCDVVCTQGVRPRLPGEFLHVRIAVALAHSRFEAVLPPRLSSLLHRAWHVDAAQRPPFGVIVNELEQLIVHSAVPDASAARLWLDAFGASDPG